MSDQALLDMQTDLYACLDSRDSHRARECWMRWRVRRAEFPLHWNTGCDLALELRFALERFVDVHGQVTGMQEIISAVREAEGRFDFTEAAQLRFEWDVAYPRTPFPRPLLSFCPRLPELQALSDRVCNLLRSSDEELASIARRLVAAQSPGQRLSSQRRLSELRLVLFEAKRLPLTAYHERKNTD